MTRAASLLGILVLVAISCALSTDRRKIPWRIVVVGTLLQAWLAVYIIRPAWVPGILTASAGACVLLQVLDRVRPLGGFWGSAARGLGWLGLGTSVVTLLARGAVWPAAIPAGLYLLWRLSPRSRRLLGDAAPLAGNLAVAALLHLGRLPDNFVYVGLDGIGRAIGWLIGFAGEGAGFVFGDLRAKNGFVFAIEVGSIILVFSALMSVLYYLRLLPWLVGAVARVLHRALGVSGAESLATASNIFVGQTEAPLVIRPYLAKMTESEVMALMTGGFATIAGSVLGAYVKFFESVGFTRGPVDLIAASVMSAPAAFVFAKIFVPETQTPETAGAADLPSDRIGRSFLDALTGGVAAGLRLAVNVMAMVLVFKALISLLDTGVSALATRLVPGSELTATKLYAWAFTPFAWLMGVPPHDCVAVGELLGTRTIFNEFIAYQRLQEMIARGEIGARASMLSVYALCGFCNFMSIGIQIGGLSGLAPEQRPKFLKLALRAMVAGAFACQLTACVVGILD